MKNIPFIFGFMVAISLLVVGCTTGSSAQINTPCTQFTKQRG